MKRLQRAADQDIKPSSVEYRWVIHRRHVVGYVKTVPEGSRRLQRDE